MGDRVELCASVEHSLEEGVSTELLRQRDGNRPAADDMARFSVVGVAPPVGLQVADDHEVGPFGSALAAAGLDHPNERQSCERRAVQLLGTA